MNIEKLEATQKDGRMLPSNRKKKVVFKNRKAERGFMFHSV